MTDHHTTQADGTAGAAPTTRPEHTRYAITLASLVASAEVLGGEPSTGTARSTGP
jgi:hypothetical protein